jgi:hypothetical protein
VAQDRATTVVKGYHVLVLLLVIVVITSAAVSLVFSATGALDPDPLTYIALPFHTDKQVYRPGETITYEVSRCVNPPGNDPTLIYLVTYEVRAVSTGQPVYSLLDRSGYIEAERGCPATTRSAIVLLPDNIPPGRYYLDGQGIPLGTRKPVASHWYTAPFTVEEAKGGQ